MTSQNCLPPKLVCYFSAMETRKLLTSHLRLNVENIGKFPLVWCNYPRVVQGYLSITRQFPEKPQTDPFHMRCGFSNQTVFAVETFCAFCCFDPRLYLDGLYPYLTKDLVLIKNNGNPSRTKEGPTPKGNQQQTNQTLKITTSTNILR